MLDEPFAGIDPKTVAEIQDQIRSLVETYNIGILLTDHQFRETLEVTDRCYLIREGRVFAYGNREQILNNPDVRRHYIGERFDVGHLLEKRRPVAIPQAASRAASRDGAEVHAELDDMSSKEIIVTSMDAAASTTIRFRLSSPNATRNARTDSPESSWPPHNTVSRWPPASGSGMEKVPASASHNPSRAGSGVAAASIGSRSRARESKTKRDPAPGYVRQVEYRCHGDSNLEIHTKVLDVMKVVAQLDPNCSEAGVWGIEHLHSPVTPGRVISRRR